MILQKRTGHIKNTTYFSNGQEKGGFRRRKPPLKIGNYSLLNYSYVDGLLAFGSRAYLELDRLTFVERLETVRCNSREVHENLLAVLRRNESVAFLAIEPFYFTCHKKSVKNVNV